MVSLMTYICHKPSKSALYQLDIYIFLKTKISKNSVFGELLKTFGNKILQRIHLKKSGLKFVKLKKSYQHIHYRVSNT